MSASVVMSYPLLCRSSMVFGCKRTRHDFVLIQYTHTHSKHTACMVTSQQTPAVTVLICPAGDCLCFFLPPFKTLLLFLQKKKRNCLFRSYVVFIVSALTFVPSCLCLCVSVCVCYYRGGLSINCVCESLISNLCVCVCVCSSSFPLCVFFWRRCTPTVWR